MIDKRIAVVILNWNGAKLLEQFLPSIIAYSDEAKIYVADNASVDNSIAVIKEKFPTITIIQKDMLLLPSVCFICVARCFLAIFHC